MNLLPKIPSVVVGAPVTHEVHLSAADIVELPAAVLARGGIDCEVIVGGGGIKFHYC